MNWFEINNSHDIDTPALLVYPERVMQNIGLAIRMTGDVSRLRPHVKTNKSSEACRLLLQAGITKFKCATIAEAEMLGMIGAPDVLLAYQPAGAKINRFYNLINKYPKTQFSCLVDNTDTAKTLSESFEVFGLKLQVYVDLNVGMNRTGIAPGKMAIELYTLILELKGLDPAGFHAYDGHIHSADLKLREEQVKKAFEPVKYLLDEIKSQTGINPVLVAGGTPTFPVHAVAGDRECSPGTFIYWDEGYRINFGEQPFLPAAVLITRVISKPSPGIICTDLGYKSVSSENELGKRLSFLNVSDVLFSGHSEEHLTIVVNNNENYRLGDVLYALPWHVCPTVALYDKLLTVENNLVTGSWDTTARKRKITV